MDLGYIVKEYRNNNELSMDEFSKRCSLSKGYISMIENNINPRNNKPIAPTLVSLKKIASGMSIELDELLMMMDGAQKISLGVNTPMDDDAKEVQQPKHHPITIPVLGHVAAGIPIEAIEDIIDWEEIPESMTKTGEYFGLKIKGDSMEPRICNGDVVIVRQQADAESGELVVVTVNGSDATCKKLFKYSNSISLISNNPTYEPMIFTNDDIASKPVRIIGKVVELRGKF